MSEDDQRWLEDKERNNWTLPFKATWLLRLPVIRIVRVIWHERKAQRSARGWGSIGIGFGGMPQYDRWVLYAIARGWA
jgi:hypothetical protein